MGKACIRVLADVNQIQECRHEIARIRSRTRQLSNVLALAGNEVRLHILYLLHREGQMCPCDLSDVIGLQVSPISQHLRKLRDLGMVNDRKVGQTIFYSLNKEVADPVIPILKQLMKTQKEAV